jgi:hypothetical protein
MTGSPIHTAARNLRAQPARPASRHVATSTLAASSTSHSDRPEGRWNSGRLVAHNPRAVASLRALSRRAGRSRVTDRSNVEERERSHRSRARAGWSSSVAARSHGSSWNAPVVEPVALAKDGARRRSNKRRHRVVRRTSGSSGCAEAKPCAPRFVAANSPRAAARSLRLSCSASRMSGGTARPSR